MEKLINISELTKLLNIDQVKNKSAKIPLKLLDDLLITMKKGCLCALCGAIPTPIMNILKYFGDEVKDDIVKEN